MSAKFLDDASKTFDENIYSLSLIGSYASMFHSARALLFKDGVIEKSHWAICEYLREKHPELGREIISGLDKYRSLRHNAAYGLDTEIVKDEAASAISFAQQMLIKIKKLT